MHMDGFSRPSQGRTLSSVVGRKRLRGRRQRWEGNGRSPMRSFQRLSLRFRIAAGVLAGLAILLSFFGLIALRTMDLSTQGALKERLRLAQISAASVDELLEHTARQLERTAVLVAGEEPYGEARVGVVYELLGEFDRIVRLSPEGRPGWVRPPAPALAWA